MSFLSIFKKPTEEISMVFDIGSGSVGGAIVKFGQVGVKPKILYSVRESLPFQKEVNADRLMSGMLRALEIVVANLEKNGMIYLNFSGLRRHKIKKVYCSLSSPWHMSTTKVLSLDKKDPFLVTKDLIEDLLDAEEENLEKNP
ncbi:MAG: hypothetical protein WCT19_03120, partial [Candidatus Paceibacterota bacterium]